MKNALMPHSNEEPITEKDIMIEGIQWKDGGLIKVIKSPYELARMLALKLDYVFKRLEEELPRVPGAKIVMIFGSVARGDYRPDSDVDVLLVVNDLGGARIKAREISSRIFADTGIPITVIVVSLDDYLEGRTSLIRRAKSEGFVIWKE